MDSNLYGDISHHVHDLRDIPPGWRRHLLLKGREKRASHLAGVVGICSMSYASVNALLVGAAVVVSSFCSVGAPPRDQAAAPDPNTGCLHTAPFRVMCASNGRNHASVRIPVSSTEV
jgi:hypothetical protein